MRVLKARGLWMAAVLGTSMGLVLTNGCVTSRVSRQQIVKAPSYGYVAEMDESASRGRLVLVSPKELDIQMRFAMSPDGRYIVASGRPDGADYRDPYQLYRISTDGASAPVKLTAGGTDNVFFPSYSSDGKHIYFWSNYSFWRMNADGSGARTKIPGSGLGTDWCNMVGSTSRMVFTSAELQSRSAGVGRSNLPIMEKNLIYAVRTDGGELTQFREGDFPYWSPDGSAIAFDYQGDIWTLGSDGRTLTQLTNSPEVNESLPAFSMDGKRVAYVSNEGKDGQRGRDLNIWAMFATGGGVQQLTELKSWDSWPVWGQDGVYFLSARGSGDQRLQRIWKIVDIEP